jgi:Tol biopolymer transport system component
LSLAARTAVAITATLVFMVVSSSDRAEASFPGENGRFLLTWGFRAPEGVWTDFMATADNAGGGLRVLAGCDYECHHEWGDWSPSGRRLVYADECPDCMDRLVTVRADGSDRKVLLRSGRGFLTSPAWSPNGRRIAFIRWRWPKWASDWVSDIYVIRRDGTHLKRVTKTKRTSEAELDWSSRNWLVFRRNKGRFRQTKYELFVMRPNGNRLRRLTDNDVPEGEPDWAPGGRRFAFVRGGDIWTAAASGRNTLRIAAGHSPTWAPDGSVIAYVGVDGAIHTVKPSGEDDTFIGSPIAEGSISQLDWQPR